MISKKILAVCLITTSLLVGCGAKETSNTNETPNNSAGETTDKFTGKKTYETLYDPTGAKGDVIVVDLDFENGEPVKVAVDVRQEDGSMKKQAAAEGKYVMKEGEKHHWGEQIEMLENFLNENKVDVSKVTLTNDAGNTDAVSGVTIKVGAYIDAIKDVIDAVKEGKELEEGFTGVKTGELDYDTTGKKKDVIMTKVVFNHGKPVAVKIDVKQEDGSMKKQAAAEGKYVMKEGEEHNWGEQIELLEKFIAENNFDLSKVTLTNDEGNTDAVSGVTIKVGRYLEAVQAVLDQVK